MLLDARGIECSTGSACSAGVAEPCHVLLAMGCDEERARGSLRFSLGHTSTEADVDALGAAIGEPSPCPPRRRSGPTATSASLRSYDRCSPPCRAASTRLSPRPARSTPVTTSPASTSRCRATPQSYRTGARGCCTIEDANDARRAADVIGIPFYVWDLAERFARDVVEDFMAEYAAGRTPNPCLRCNEKIKFAAVLDRALALGFDAVCTGHYARIDGRRPASCTGRSTTARTSPTCSACSPRTSWRTRCSRSATRPSRRSARRPRRAACSSPTSPTATTSASSPTATPPACCARSSGAAPG